MLRVCMTKDIDETVAFARERPDSCATVVRRPDETRATHLLLYDGACGLCRRMTRWARRHDRAGAVEAVPYQEAPSPPMTPELSEACARAVHVITTDGRVFRAGRATLFVLGQVGWPCTARVLSLPPFVWIVELAYHLVATNRHLISKILIRDRGPA